MVNRFTSPEAKDGPDLICIRPEIFKQVAGDRLAFSLTSKCKVVGLSLGHKIRETEVQNLTLCKYSTGNIVNDIVITMYGPRWGSANIRGNTL